MAEQKRTDVRALAHSALMMINEEGRLSHLVVREALDKYDFLSRRDKALFHRLVNGTLEYQNTLDGVIDSLSSIKAAKMKPYIRNLIRMGAYQIIYMDKIPDSAACNESVRLVRGSALRGLSGFVNGVLRSISRNIEGLVLGRREARYSVRRWMLDELDATIGREATDRFLEDTLKERAVYVRVADMDVSGVMSDACVSGKKSGRIEKLLGDSGMTPVPMEIAGIAVTDMYTVKEPESITDTELWQSGRAFVQDISSSMPVRLSGITEGMTVIDVCAAPGGKAVQAAQQMRGTGRVIACDISEKKAELIRENAARTGCSNIDVRVCDATEYHEEFEALADVVIADLPCSGIGTISHKPDIKNRLTHEDVLSLAGLQRRILDNVCRYVKPGGRLIYSTCTLTHEENQDNADAFIKAHPEYSIVKTVTMLPCDAYSCDGFYVGVIQGSKHE